MMNLVLLTAVLSFGAPTAQPANVEVDSQKTVAVCSEVATHVPAVSPVEQEALPSLASTEPEDSVIESAARPDESLSLRYCCTPQQVNACIAIGGTTSCRTGVCQCWF